MTEWVEVGRIVKPHGLQGELVVELITDREERLAVGAVVRARRGDDRHELVVVRSRPLRPGTERRHARWIVRFEGLTTVEAAEAWRDTVLLAEPVVDPDAMWVDDLVGSDVVLAADGSHVGSCVAVVANPAADLLELDNGSLVPVVFVVGQSGGEVVIDPPDGLFDL